MEFKHEPVLLNECIENLNIKKDGIYVDGTLGGAGHSSEILKHLSAKGKLIGIDKDEDALKASGERLKKYDNVTFVQGNHNDIKEILNDLNIENVDGILLDLGMSSYQIDEAERGFSYMQEGKLDMRMDKTQMLSAWNVVNSYKEDDLAKIFFEYGEEKFSRKMAKIICTYRKNKSIDTTTELANIIKKEMPFNKKSNSHPAKKIFQAIRIEVNDELKPLYNTVVDCIKALKVNGRLCIITFHSLEDRIVKKAFLDNIGTCTCPKDLPKCICNNVSLGKIITKKPIIPNDEEMKKNSRAQSAKLRVFERK